MINDWVNAQEQHLSDQMDTTKLNAVHEDDEVLWMEFKTTFADAWMDTSMRQNTYNQLIKLTMAGWVSRRPAHSTYLRLTHKPWASYGYALGLSDWRLVSGFDCVGTPE